MFAGEQKMQTQTVSNLNLVFWMLCRNSKAPVTKKEFRKLLVAEMENLRVSDGILGGLVIPPVVFPNPILANVHLDPDLAWWNDGGARQFNNNCYNYATNYRTDTFAQPGKAAGQQYTSLSGCAVAAGQRSALDGAIADALINTPLLTINVLRKAIW